MLMLMSSSRFFLTSFRFVLQSLEELTDVMSESAEASFTVTLEQKWSDCIFTILNKSDSFYKHTKILPGLPYFGNLPAFM